ncbi:MAG TPA: DivIVA domain-containing protein [Candidatus Limosilactobacillus merdigallinarum]|uniref:DivIVA domain-containing protein n=1 Tax=Candidatus Limosilactobacillus merdigallinarum TaxID=2838652 RepID=A0A9D1VIT1_9LACO|nr:DivIVA domain-containing protein [Candidatus Limosilactobacillus merdigallinarum]
MTVSADEISNKSFDNKMRGYNPKEVQSFLKEVADTVRELTDKNRELQEIVKGDKEKLRYFTDLKDSLNKSILVAQEAADKVKNNAKKEAEIMVREAQKQATDIVSEANDKANAVVEDSANSTRKLVTETNDLKKQTRIFRQRLQVMLESQLEVVKSSDWDQLLANDDTDKYEEIQKALGNKVDNDQSASVQSDATSVVDQPAVSDQPAASVQPAPVEPASAENSADSDQQGVQTVVIFPDSESAAK